MKTVIRIFALFVAVAGLASASIAPATTQTAATHRSMYAVDPGPDDTLPVPVPCQLINACVAPAAVAR
ncbi:MAG: hypothetical protein ABSF23_00630 [Terracidiphilus sp.]